MQVSNCCTTTLMAFLYHHSSKPVSLSSASLRQHQIIGRGGRHYFHTGRQKRQLPSSTRSSPSLSMFPSSSSSMYHSSSSTALSSSPSSSFEPPEPPVFNGTPIFPNVNFESESDSNSNSNSIRRNSDPDAVYVITGASRGIGLQMVQSLSSRVNGTIIACCRNPSDASQLRTFVDNYNTNNSNNKTARKIVIEALDVEDQPSIDALATKLTKSHGRVDVLLNVAGILGDGGVTTPGPERSIRNLDRDWAAKTMNVNYFGPLFVSQALAPLMKTKVGGRKKGNNDQQPRPVSIIANLSARVGSISDNGLGGWISYRSSKAALNQATRTMALELKRQGTWTVSLHPGTTDTDLSKPFQRNVREGRLFPVEFTAGRLLDVVDCMEEVHSGGFYDWSGTALPF